MSKTSGEAWDQPWRQRVVQLVLCESVLWAAGNALTTGAFLFYFARDLGAAGLVLGLVSAVPETSGILRLLAPWVIARLGNRKRTYLAASLLARVFAVGIPLTGFAAVRSGVASPVALLVVLLFLSQACQWLAYVAYLSWLSDIMPSTHWGRFFGLRNSATLVMALLFPLLGGAFRDFWVKAYGGTDEIVWAYAVPFWIGTALMALSLAPMVLVPRGANGAGGRSGQGGKPWRGALADRSFRRFLAYGCWLAAWGGLIQAPYMLYAQKELGLGLMAVSFGFTLMKLCQIPVSYAAGYGCDTLGNKPVLIAGLWSVVAGTLVWIFVTPATWPVVYLAFWLWGGWAAVNVAQPNLMLKLAPAGAENATYIALFQGMTGLCAGLSGIVGGWLLDALPKLVGTWTWGGLEWQHYQWLFLLSAVGRASALVLLRGVRESRGLPLLSTNPSRNSGTMSSVTQPTCRPPAA